VLQDQPVRNFRRFANPRRVSELAQIGERGDVKPDERGFFFRDPVIPRQRPRRFFSDAVGQPVKIAAREIDVEMLVKIGFDFILSERFRLFPRHRAGG
jgi:hypothetical protein